jgi:hypothetical protein
MHVTDDDRADRRLDARRRLDAALTALTTLTAHTTTATADPISVRCLAIAVVDGCDQLVMLDTLEAEDTHTDDAFARFMAGDDRRDDVAELVDFAF